MTAKTSGFLSDIIDLRGTMKVAAGEKTTVPDWARNRWSAVQHGKNLEVMAAVDAGAYLLGVRPATLQLLLGAAAVNDVRAVAAAYGAARLPVFDASLLFLFDTQYG